MPTTPRGIWTPDDSDDWDLTVDLAASALSTDAAIGNSQNALRGLTSAMPPAGQEGRTYYATDTNRSWFDNGTSWISNDAGMYLIRPNAITGGTVAADGTALPSDGANAMTVDLGSLARYRTVKVELYFEPTASDSPWFRFRRAGAILSAGGSYLSQRLGSNGPSVSGDYAPEHYGHLGRVAQNVTHAEVTFHNLGVSGPKGWVISGYQGAANPQTIQISGLKNDSEVVAAVDGFQFGWIASTFKAGSNNYVKIYGMA